MIKFVKLIVWGGFHDRYERSFRIPFSCLGPDGALCWDHLPETMHRKIRNYLCGISDCKCNAQSNFRVVLPKCRYGIHSNDAELLENRIDNLILGISRHDNWEKQRLTRAWGLIHWKAKGDFEHFKKLAYEYQKLRGV